MQDKKNLKKKILKAAYQEGLVENNESLFEKLKLKKTTVEYVLEKFNEQKYFTKCRYVINLNALSLGKFAWVFLSINWENFNEEEFEKKLFNITQVHTIAEITGEYDFALKLIGPNIQNLNTLILALQKLFPEIIETKILFTNKEYIYHYNPVHDTSLQPLKEIDLLILAEKDQNPKMKLNDIAKKYNLHRNTISSRWNNLWDNKIIYKCAIDLTSKGYDFVDLGLKAFIILKVNPLEQDHLINSLKNNTTVQDLFTTLSNEIVIITRTKNSDDLITFYRKLAKLNKSIIRSNTIIFLTKKTKSGLNITEVKRLLEKTNNL